MMCPIWAEAQPIAGLATVSILDYFCFLGSTMYTRAQLDHDLRLGGASAEGKCWDYCGYMTLAQGNGAVAKTVDHLGYRKLGW